MKIFVLLLEKQIIMVDLHKINILEKISLGHEIIILMLYY